MYGNDEWNDANGIERHGDDDRPVPEGNRCLDCGRAAPLEGRPFCKDCAELYE